MADELSFKPSIKDTPKSVRGVLSSRDKVIGILVIVGLIAMSVIVWAITNASTSLDGSGSEAQRTCERAVEQMLAAPSTAKFSSSASGSNPYEVTGVVDSENVFGAMLRSSFGCTVTFQSGVGTATVNFLE